MDQKELYSYIQEYQPNICQIIILQRGWEIYSAEWNGYRREDCTHIMSATKSIVALLFGIAIDHGMIGSVNDKVLSYFPEYSVKRGEKTIYDVTVKHLLTMRAPYKGKGQRCAPAMTGQPPHLIFLAGDGALLMSLITGRSACIFSPAFSIRLLI